MAGFRLRCWLLSSVLWEQPQVPKSCEQAQAGHLDNSGWASPLPPYCRKPKAALSSRFPSDDADFVSVCLRAFHLSSIDF